MKHTLNATGQAAIVRLLAELDWPHRPWDAFKAIEERRNDPIAIQAYRLTRVDGKHCGFEIEPAWFDTAPEPATFGEVVAMLKALRPHFVRSGDLCLRIDALLARCPKE